MAVLEHVLHGIGINGCYVAESTVSFPLMYLLRYLQLNFCRIFFCLLEWVECFAIAKSGTFVATLELVLLTV